MRVRKFIRQHANVTTTALHIHRLLMVSSTIIFLCTRYDSGNALQVSTEAIQSKIKTSSCYLARNADVVRAFKYSESLGLACSTITSKTASVTDGLHGARNPIQTYAVFIRKVAFYVSYAFISMLCLLLATFVAYRLKLPTQATFFLTYVVVSILTIASCGIMIIVVRSGH